MIDTEFFEQLRQFLTKEFMSLSHQKDDLMGEKIHLEVEKQKEEQQLFDNIDVLKIKSFFSPLAKEILDREDFDSLKNDNISHKLQIIQNQLSDIDVSMEEIKQYLFFIQILENERKEMLAASSKRCAPPRSVDQIGDPAPNDTNLRPATDRDENHLSSDNIEKTGQMVASFKTENKKISNDTKVALEDMADYLQKKYPKTEILLDIEEMDEIGDWKFHCYFIDLLTDTISSSIETSSVDTVILEGSQRENVLLITVQMLLENERLEQYSFQYEVTLHTSPKNDF